MRRVIYTALGLSLVAAACTTTETPGDDAPDSGGAGGAQNGGSSGSSMTKAGASGTGTSGTGTGGVSGSAGAASGAGGGAGVNTTGGTPGVGGISGSGGGSGGTPPATGGGAGAATGGVAGTDAAGSSGSSSGGASGTAGTGGAPGGGFVSCPYTPPADPSGTNAVAGTVTSFNDDGAWTWYCDERSVVDAAGGKIIIGSDANGRSGVVEAVVYDVATGMGTRQALGTLAPDDHNTPALLVKPDGGYVAAWAGHNENCNTYWRTYANGQWSATKTFAWGSLGCPTSSGRQVTYNNLWNMSAEGKIYNFVRSVDTSPNILVSSDGGENWTYGGRLTFSPTVGYVAGYYKYWGNGVDRIDFFGTEAHPRDNDNNLWHGYVKGGKSYNTFDEVIDDDITNGNGPDVDGFTRIFSTGTNLGGETFNHMWNSDVMRYDDGTIAAIGMGRTQNDGNNPDHSFVYLRFNGTEWKSTNLGKAGKKLYDSEQDYVGLGSLHPNDPRVVYISTPIDPRDDSALSSHEIFQGVTCDEGATFQWTPITWNSNRDNLRPIVPAWDGNNMVLLWFRGSYSTAQIYDEEVVGIITRGE
jgi:hypothetical protein